MGTSGGDYMDKEKIHTIAEQSKLDVCPECKEKIKIAMGEVRKRDMLHPKRLAKKFGKIVCSKCRAKIRGRLQS